MVAEVKTSWPPTDRPQQRAAHALGHAQEVAALGHVVDEDAELLAAQVRERVLRAHARDQPARHRGEELVAGQMPESGLHRREAVQVEQEDAEAVPGVAPAASHRLPHALEEERAVGETGDGIVHHGMEQPLLGLALLGGVEEHGQGALARAARRPRLRVPLEETAPPGQLELGGQAHARAAVRIEGRLAPIAEHLGQRATDDRASVDAARRDRAAAHRRDAQRAVRGPHERGQPPEDGVQARLGVVFDRGMMGARGGERGPEPSPAGIHAVPPFRRPTPAAPGQQGSWRPG